MSDQVPAEVLEGWRKDREEHDARMAEWEALSDEEKKARWDAQTKALEEDNHRRAMNRITGRVDAFVASNDRERIAERLCTAIFDLFERPLLDRNNDLPQILRDFLTVGSLLKPEYPCPQPETEAWCTFWGDRLRALDWIWRFQDEILTDHGVEYMRGDDYLGLDSHRVDMLHAIGDDHCYTTRGAARVLHNDNIPVGCSDVHDGFFLVESHGKIKLVKIRKHVHFRREIVHHYPNREIWAKMWDFFVKSRVNVRLRIL